MVEYLQGTIQIANMFLALVAGGTALTLFRAAHKREHLRPWKLLIGMLVLFAVLQINGGLIAFGFIKASFISHLSAGVMMLLLILALESQIKEYTFKRGQKKVRKVKKRKKR